MIRTIQGYFKLRGWRVGDNKPSTTSCTGRFSHEVWNNALSPKINELDAVQWILKMKKEINQKQKN